MLAAPSLFSANDDVVRFFPAEGYVVPLDHELHGVSQGSTFLHENICSGHEAHLEQPLLQKTATAHRLDDGTVSLPEVPQREGMGAFSMFIGRHGWLPSAFHRYFGSPNLFRYI